MTKDNLIQQSLFSDENQTVTSPTNISKCKNLTNESLANNGKMRPRVRQNSKVNNCNKNNLSKINAQDLISNISPLKDVDGLHEVNIGKLVKGESALRSCTPAGIINLLLSQGISIEGKRVVVIGRSLLVGKPVSMMILNQNGTVTIAHSKTKNLVQICNEADILIVAAGRPKLIDSSYIKKGAIIIDVGIHKLKSSNNNTFELCGDVKLKEVIPKVTAYTPVPGGVGPMTVTMLLVNTIFSWQRNCGIVSTVDDLLP